MNTKNCKLSDADRQRRTDQLATLHARQRACNVELSVVIAEICDAAWAQKVNPTASHIATELFARGFTSRTGGLISENKINRLR